MAEKNVKKLEKQLQKTEIRLRKKNQKMMDLNKVKKTREAEIEELKSKIKDLEFLLEQKDADLNELNKNYDEKYADKIKKLEEENKKLLDELADLKAELSKKTAIIELLQKPEYEYHGIVSLDLERIKTNWVGWPEGANLEEIDFVIVNNSTDPLKDVSVDIYLEDAEGNNYKFENYPVKSVLKPKERISRKISLFKQLKKKGTYKLELRVFMNGHDKEIAEQTKIFTI